MKLLLKITLGAILATSSLVAQVSDECRKNASLGIESAKVKNYVEAAPYLLKVRQNCPTYSLAIYQYSERLLRDKLSKASADQKKQIVNELIALFEERKQHFASKTAEGDMISDVALLMYENKIGTQEEQFLKFNEAYTKDKENFTGPKKIYTYFSLLLGIQSEGKKEISEVFGVYDDLIEKIEVEENKMAAKIAKYAEKEDSGLNLLSKEKKALAKAEKNLKVYSQVKTSIDKKLGKLADCPYLIPLFNEQFASKKDDISWVKQSARRMYKKECTTDPLFLKLVEQQHKLDPSADTAKYLGKLAEQRADVTAARKYYEESADLETNPNRKAEVYIAIALSEKTKGNYGNAKKFFNKALQFKPSLGGAYLQIASMIGKSANNCGSDEFNKRAVYWLAANYAKKAGRVDPSVANRAQKTANSYMASAPSKSDVFTKGMQGKTISIGCWIGESVKVPNL